MTVAVPVSEGRHHAGWCSLKNCLAGYVSGFWGFVLIDVPGIHAQPSYT
ncbi:hypothetical protein BLL52_1707 [Rhodoferax antarcticus ANT.BR]|uniref:Uncharacterized protein n=1 Tax=Rhodoferax antarcticus ANT.BR TaxID=1111071 RepID=A0A1Q8YFY4_9BURK|nr:hypothetical protein BLL52_1707 [Rhodoferax antarcticus ANT.BR]